MNLGMGVVIKAENDWRRVGRGGLKFQCIAMAIISSVIVN